MHSLAPSTIDPTHRNADLLLVSGPHPERSRSSFLFSGVQARGTPGNPKEKRKPDGSQHPESCLRQTEDQRRRKKSQAQSPLSRIAAECSNGIAISHNNQPAKQ